METKTQNMDVSGKNITYYDVGDRNAPAILMGHSFLWDKDMWQPQIETLSSQHRLIVPDLWAHGESDNLPASPTSIQKLSDDHWQLMKNLGIDCFSIIGLSVGGMWSTQMALDHPNHIRALIIMGTFVGSEPPNSQDAYLALMNQFKQDRKFTEELIEATWPYFYSKNLPGNSPLITELKQRLRQIPSRNVEDVYEIGKAIFTRQSNLENLSQLKMPFAIISGEDDVARVPSESEEMAKAAHCKNLFRIKNAGHISNLEQPNEVSKCLLKFLEVAHIKETA